MKKILAIAAIISTVSNVVYGQGNINLTNPSTQPILYASGGVLGAGGQMPTRTTGVFSTYYISCLLVDSGSGLQPFIYRTNSGALTGTISAGSSIVYPDVLAHNFQVVTWSYDLGGLSYATMLANIGGNIAAPQSANGALVGLYVGASTVGNFTAVPSPGTPFNLFGTGTGQVTGYTMNVVAPVPEPSTMALAALGGASLLLFRRRK